MRTEKNSHKKKIHPFFHQFLFFWKNFITLLFKLCLHLGEIACSRKLGETPMHIAHFSRNDSFGEHSSSNTVLVTLTFNFYFQLCLLPKLHVRVWSMAYLCYYDSMCTSIFVCCRWNVPNDHVGPRKTS